MTIPVFCETGEIALEADQVARGLGLPIRAELTPHPLDSAARASAMHVVTAALCVQAPDPADAIRARELVPSTSRLVLATISERDLQVLGLASDLGFVCVREVAAAVSALALVHSGASRPFRASTRKLSALDQVRLERAVAGQDRSAGKLVSLSAGEIALHLPEVPTPVLLGHATWAAQALRALQAAEPCPDAVVSSLQPPDPASTRDVLFGPPRVLSDPASKAALLPFGLPMPQEELCASPSRASSEAARIGFPVRISLASPDLRVWDYPELSVDGVDNAARVRDIYRQLVSVAEERAPTARVLGVTVTATTLARALIRVSARPAPSGRVILRIGFSDPHGATAKDTCVTSLPASRGAIERMLGRLAAESLLLGEKSAERERTLQLLCQLFASVGSFVDTYRDEVARVELHPVALLVGGGAEVREAAIEVTDAFLRELG